MPENQPDTDPETEPAAPSPDEARRRMVWWVVGIIGCGLGVAAAIWLGLANSRPVTWTQIGFEIVDDHTVTVNFDVHRPSGTPVTCTVRALDVRFGVVGAVEVDIPASPAEAVNQTVTVNTTTRAVTGIVHGCSSR